MEQEETELKKTYARALKDRDAIWNKLKLHLFEKRKNENEGDIPLCVSNGYADNFHCSKPMHTEKRKNFESDTKEHKAELEMEFEHIQSFSNASSELSYEWKSSTNSSLLDSNGMSFSFGQSEEDDESLEFSEIFEVDENISPAMGPATEEDVSTRSISCNTIDDDDDDDDDDEFWEQESNKNFAGFSSVEKQGMQIPKPSSSLPIFIQRKNSVPPSQRISSIRIAKEEDDNEEEEGKEQSFCHGLVVDRQYKSIPYSDKANSFSVPKKRITFV